MISLFELDFVVFSFMVVTIVCVRAHVAFYMCICSIHSIVLTLLLD